MAKETDVWERWGIADATSKVVAIFSGAIEQLPNVADAGARGAILEVVREVATVVRRINDRIANEADLYTKLSFTLSISDIVATFSRAIAQLVNAKNADEIHGIVKAAVEQHSDFLWDSELDSRS